MCIELLRRAILLTPDRRIYARIQRQSIVQWRTIMQVHRGPARRAAQCSTPCSTCTAVTPAVSRGTGANTRAILLCWSHLSLRYTKPTQHKLQIADSTGCDCVRHDFARSVFDCPILSSVTSPEGSGCVCSTGYSRLGGICIIDTGSCWLQIDTRRDDEWATRRWC